MPAERPPVLVSACLLGHKCRYDGQDAADKGVLALADHFHFIPVCPEQLGGLPTPRLPAEIGGRDGADVLTGKARVQRKDGADVTQAFLQGAQAALAIGQEHGIKLAICQERSPSCGVHQIYDGSFSGRLQPGSGVFTALLKDQGWQVLAPTDLSFQKPTGL
jgi:uncharacterized protein YbbK (DUF523 family)